MREATIEVAGTKLGYREAGAGATVLFLHGAAGAAWDPLLDQLSGGYRVLAPEHPGFGRGQVPDWMMSVGDVAFFYLDLMQALQLRDVHLVGHGLGGWIAAEIAIRNTGALASLALLAPAGVETREAMFDDIFAWTVEEFARRQFHDAKLAQEWQRNRPSSTSTSACRTARRWRGSAGTRACTIRNCPIGCIASMFQHC